MSSSMGGGDGGSGMRAAAIRSASLKVMFRDIISPSSIVPLFNYTKNTKTFHVRGHQYRNANNESTDAVVLSIFSYDTPIYRLYIKRLYYILYVMHHRVEYAKTTFISVFTRSPHGPPPQSRGQRMRGCNLESVWRPAAAV